MRRVFKILVPLAIIVSTVFIVKMVLDNPPKAKRGVKPQKQEIPIEVKEVQKRDFTIYLDSYGLAQATTKTTLSTQVSGEIVYVNKNLKNGAYFKKGELLLEIEKKEYEADVSIAKADVLLAKQNLLEEEAMVLQAKEDWKRFNGDKKPNSLVLREPQLESVKASLIAAQANLDKALLNLNRTKIYAPFDGRVLEKLVSISQVVSSNTQIATIYENSSIEVRLPIKNADIKLIDLNSSITLNSLVKFYSKTTDKEYIGNLVRSESSIDTNTKQLYLISDIKKDARALILGEYLKAKILAKSLKGVIVVPNNSIYQGSYLYIHKNGAIYKKEVEILWQDSEISIIKEGLKEGDWLVLTTLGQVSSGTKVRLTNKEDRR